MRDRWETGRLEAFSDGVFAIAITLLVLDVRVPSDAFGDLWRGLLDQWPAYLGFATSFITIGGLWMAHHNVIGRLRYADGSVMRVNLLLLMAVSFLPFPTRLMAEAMEDASSERIAVLLYGACLLVIALLYTALWSVAVRDRKLLREDVGDVEIRQVFTAVSPGIGFHVVFMVAALLAPRAAAIGFLVVAILVVLRVRGSAPAPAAP